MVTDNQCEGRMGKQERNLGREIGQIRELAKEAKTCAGKKLEKGTFRWTVSIMILVLGGILTFVTGLVIYNGRTVNSSEKTVATMGGKVDATKEKVDDLDKDFREWRTEQRTQFTELKDLIEKSK